MRRYGDVAGRSAPTSAWCLDQGSSVRAGPWQERNKVDTQPSVQGPIGESRCGQKCVRICRSVHGQARVCMSARARMFLHVCTCLCTCTCIIHTRAHLNPLHSLHSALCQSSCMCSHFLSKNTVASQCSVSPRCRVSRRCQETRTELHRVQSTCPPAGVGGLCPWLLLTRL